MIKLTNKQRAGLREAKARLGRAWKNVLWHQYSCGDEQSGLFKLIDSAHFWQAGLMKLQDADLEHAIDRRVLLYLHRLTKRAGLEEIAAGVLSMAGGCKLDLSLLQSESVVSRSAKVRLHQLVLNVLTADEDSIRSAIAQCSAAAQQTAKDEWRERADQHGDLLELFTLD